ncbi:MAG: hypothetical protein K2L98_03565 [Bacilli bacterium]|nr:hypothetical protein [Bacilli bacterium]
MKVNSVRNARSKFFNSFRAVTGTAAIGLGIAGLTLGTGMIGPLVAGGLFAAGTAYEGYVKIKENIKYGALKHKLKKIAKKMSKEANLNIKFEMDPETRRAGFKLEGSDEFLTTSDLHQSEDFADGMDDIVVDIFENSFKRANKYRGKGESASNLKEVRYRDFPQITFDNVTAAFEEFGGVKTRKELNDYQFDYNKIIQARIEEQENFVESNDNISSVDIDLDELEAMEAYAQNGQNPPVSGPAPTGPDNGQQPAPVGGPNPAGPDNGQNPPAPVVVQPLAPSSQDPNVVQVQFPQADQDQLKAELANWIRSEVQDPTNGIAVADKLEEAIVGRKDELSEQSKVDLVNLFHAEVKFTEGQMERFNFICRNDRTLTDFEVKEAIAQLEQVRATQGETQLGMAVSAFINEHSNITKEDLEALHRFDTSKNMGFEEAINSKFYGQGPTK